MIAAARRFAPRTVAGQLTGVLVGAVLFGVFLASAVMFYLVYSGGIGPSRQTLVQIRAARIAAVVNGVLEARELGESLYVPKNSNSEAVSVTWAKPPTGEPTGAAAKNLMITEIEQDLQRGWRLDILPRTANKSDSDSIYVKVDDQHALRFAVTPYAGVGSLVLSQTLFTIGVITFVILFVSAYAVRWITAPLSSIASAARAFGRPGQSDASDLLENGPIEVAQAARALNEMRKRVRRLVDERTRMLVAVSHDLRTPLTRLRLRIERLRDEPAQAAMLEEIAGINEMLSETLAYMREVGQTESSTAIDLPSLLQTICGQFADTGHNVSYEGPDRLALRCRPHALTRAVTNLVDNACKFGERVEVEATRRGDEVWIDVTDDGPGVPESMLGPIFEPFYKGDNARSQRGSAGFGLGLAIVREIAEAHGGGIVLRNHPPRGLRARLSVPLAGIATPAAQ